MNIFHGAMTKTTTMMMTKDEIHLSNVTYSFSANTKIPNQKMVPWLLWISCQSTEKWSIRSEKKREPFQLCNHQCFASSNSSRMYHLIVFFFSFLFRLFLTSFPTQLYFQGKFTIEKKVIPKLNCEERERKKENIQWTVLKWWYFIKHFVMNMRPKIMTFPFDYNGYCSCLSQCLCDIIHHAFCYGLRVLSHDSCEKSNDVNFWYVSHLDNHRGTRGHVEKK